MYDLKLSCVQGKGDTDKKGTEMCAQVGHCS